MEEANNINRGWVLNDGKRRVLDAFYTSHGTKLFVENGVLVEEVIHDSDTLQTSAPGFFETQSSDAPAYPPPPPPPPLPAEEKVSDMSQTIDTARAALEYYNSKHHTTYELKEPVESCGYLKTGGIWFHSNFKAKQVTSSESCDGTLEGDSSFFFAELKLLKDEPGKATKFLVTACRPLDGTKTTSHCEMCGEGIVVHPPNGFRQGLYRYKPRALRPRSNGKVLASGAPAFSIMKCPPPDSATFVECKPTFSSSYTKCPPPYSATFMIPNFSSCMRKTA